MTEHFERLHLSGGAITEMTRRKRGLRSILKPSLLIAVAIIVFLFWLFYADIEMG